MRVEVARRGTPPALRERSFLAAAQHPRWGAQSRLPGATSASAQHATPTALPPGTCRRRAALPRPRAAASSTQQQGAGSGRGGREPMTPPYVVLVTGSSKGEFTPAAAADSGRRAGLVCRWCVPHSAPPSPSAHPPPPSSPTQPPHPQPLPNPSPRPHSHPRRHSPAAPQASGAHWLRSSCARVTASSCARAAVSGALRRRAARAARPGLRARAERAPAGSSLPRTGVCLLAGGRW